jgi:hypothetical protein
MPKTAQLYFKFNVMQTELLNISLGYKAQNCYLTHRIFKFEKELHLM